MIDIPKLKEHVYDVVGALYEVHKELGAGLNEFCYQEGLQIQLEESGIQYDKELTFHPKYHNTIMQTHYRVDFLCKGNVVVECKAVAELVSNHRAQLFNYMRLLKCPCGILVNFLPKFAEIERYFLNAETMEIIGQMEKQYSFYRKSCF